MLQGVFGRRSLIPATFLTQSWKCFASSLTSSYRIEETNQRDTFEYRAYFVETQTGRRVSPWHEISIGTIDIKERILTFVNEIPKGTLAKMEMNKNERKNPIAQDVKKGQLRYFKYGTIPFNYGFLPQTWENPDIQDPITAMRGDNDPLDVVELSSPPLDMGVYEVKVLGLIGLVDEGEMDWKVLAIRSDDPKAASLTKPSDFAGVLPGVLEKVHDWFENYKVPDGKPQNAFAFEGQLQDIVTTYKVIEHAHSEWRRMKKQ